MIKVSGVCVCVDRQTKNGKNYIQHLFLAWLIDAQTMRENS